MDSTTEARIDANVQTINENIAKIYDRMGTQNERVAKVEGRQDGFEKALQGLKDDEQTYEQNHSGPGGDHDRLSNFHIAMVTTLVGVAGIVVGIAGYLWMVR